MYVEQPGQAQRLAFIGFGGRPDWLLCSNSPFLPNKQEREPLQNSASFSSLQILDQGRFSLWKRPNHQAEFQFLSF
jgi:hypothetical protein